VSEGKRFFTVAEAAPILHLHPFTVYRLIGEGKIGAIKCGGRRLIPASVLDQMEQSALIGAAGAVRTAT
jgi:excisionase family DNA binding protein